MEEGKIDYELLEKMISRYGFRDKSVVIGPGIGIDCAVLDVGKEYIVATTDPVTFVSSAEYCINVNVNDVVSMGAEPWFFMATIILPPKSREKELDTIMKEISNGCKRFKINFGGGHTEVNPIVKEPLISGFMVGRCKKSELRGSFNARDGDLVLLTKGVSIEGTTIIAEKRKKEIEKKWGKPFLERCQSFKKQLSVLKEAEIAKKSANGMHDVTEGGVINTLYEICVASEVSIEVESIPVFRETEELCKRFGLDPLGLISSGSLIITTKDPALLDRLEKSGIKTYNIGKVLKDGKNEVRMNGKVVKFFDRDEIIEMR